MPEENQGTGTDVVVGTKRKATEEDIEGNQTSVTHMGADGTNEPNMGISAERPTGTRCRIVETGSSLAASVAVATNAATDDAASIETEGNPSLAANTNAESKDSAMADENNTDSDSSDDKFCSAAEEGTSSDDGKTIIKRRKVEEWVIPNPVETALHPTMDLQGKRNKIMTELVGQQLTEALNQHSLNLNILVPVIAAWDETLTEYTAKLLNEIERRKQHMQHLDDRYSRTLQKQVNNTAAVPCPVTTAEPPSWQNA